MYIALRISKTVCCLVNNLCFGRKRFRNAIVEFHEEVHKKLNIIQASEIPRELEIKYAAI
jgi:hypothetical protein